MTPVIRQGEPQRAPGLSAPAGHVALGGREAPAVSDDRFPPERMRISRPEPSGGNRFWCHGGSALRFAGGHQRERINSPSIARKSAARWPSETRKTRRSARSQSARWAATMLATKHAPPAAAIVA